MEISLGVSPSAFWSWLLGIFKSLSLWVLSGRKYYLIIIGVIVAIIIIHNLLYKYLSNYYKFRNEKFISAEKRK